MAASRSRDPADSCALAAMVYMASGRLRRLNLAGPAPRLQWEMRLGRRPLQFCGRAAGLAILGRPGGDLEGVSIDSGEIHWHFHKGSDIAGPLLWDGRSLVMVPFADGTWSLFVASSGKRRDGGKTSTPGYSSLVASLVQLPGHPESTTGPRGPLDEVGARVAELGWSLGQAALHDQGRLHVCAHEPEERRLAVATLSLEDQGPLLVTPVGNAFEWDDSSEESNVPDETLYRIDDVVVATFPGLTAVLDSSGKLLARLPAVERAELFDGNGELCWTGWL